MVALSYGVDHFLALDHLAEHGVHAVQVRSWLVRDEELRAVRAVALYLLTGVRVMLARTGMRHGQRARIMFQVRPDLAVDIITGSASARTQRAAALDHEIIDHTVEL